MKEYQLRDMATGLFDTGKNQSGYEPPSGHVHQRSYTHIVWGKRGKRFKQLNHLSLRLSYVTDVIMSTWEVIEYELVESSRFSAMTLAKAKK